MKAKVQPTLRALSIIFLLVLSCKEPFDPNIPGEDLGYLVVEGYINVGSNAVTKIILTRTNNLSKGNSQSKEQGAQISINDDTDNFFPLLEQDKGVYYSLPLTLSSAKRYRIVIHTSSGKEYFSEYVTPIISPSIDSVTWERSAAGVDISVTTHDPANQTHYYQWNYEQIWHIRSPYRSSHAFKNGTIVIRPEEEITAMWECWKYEYPINLILSSTAALTSDVILKRRLVNIPNGDEKLSRKYAIVIEQHALSKDAYDYFTLMNKNTDAVGSFSDPQPAALYGNLHAVLNDEPVVGFVGAYTTTRTRIFIKAADVPGWNFSLGCPEYFVDLNDPDSVAKYFVNLHALPTKTDTIGNVYATPERCADCRLRGGTNNKPIFWDE